MNQPVQPVKRDRDGEPVEEVSDLHVCRRGWLSPANADRPVPCPTCRPWLVAHPARPPTVAELDRFRAIHQNTP